MYGSQMGSLTVQASSDGGLTWSADLWGKYGVQSAFTSSSSPWLKATLDMSAYGGLSNVKFRIRGFTNLNLSDMAIDDIRVYSSAPQTFSASTSSQTQGYIFQNTANQSIMQIKIDMNGDISPLIATTFSFNTNGTTLTSDITNAKLWYTGNTGIFSGATQVGTTVSNPSGSFQINANTALSVGSNHFWLTYDIPLSATLGNYADAEVTQIVIGGVNRTPAVTSPPQTKMIVGQTITGSGGSPSMYHPISGYTYYVATEILYLASEIGTPKNLLTAGFLKASGTALDSIKNIKLYMKHDAATTLSTGTYSLAGYSLVYDGSWTNNAPSGWMDVNLQNPFTYNGTENLRILVVQTVGTIVNPYPYWQYAGFSPIKCRYSYSTTTAPTSLAQNANRPHMRFLYNSPTGMSYVSSTTSQASTNFAILGAANQEVLAMQVVTNNSINPLNATSFTVNTTGTTNVTDISAAKIYYTGTNSAFSIGSATLFGAAVNNPSGTFTITGTQALQQGTNYFWLVYDISPTATINNFVDGQCTSIIVDGVTRTPAVTNPAGNRQIKPYLLIGDFTTSSFSIPMHYSSYSASEFIYLQSEMNGAKDLTKIAFYKVSGVNTFESIQNVSIYLKNSSGTTMSSGTYSILPDYTLVYSGPFPNNAASGWMEVPFNSSFFYNGTQNLHVLVVKTVSPNITGYPNWGVRSVSPNRCRTAYNFSTPVTSLTSNSSIPIVRFEY
jgi:hypothetical protein